MRKIFSLILAGFLLTAGIVKADEARYYFDPQFPRDVLDIGDFRNTLRGLNQGDFGPLRPMAKILVDEQEYSDDTSAQVIYSGTGITITSDNSNEQEGSFSLKAVTDGTSNRELAGALTISLEGFTSLTVWERSSQTSDTIQFYVEDSSGDRSIWDITTNGSANTWQQDTLTLASPDSNNGSDADLSDIVELGYMSLTASTTYYFDTIKGIVGMVVVVRGSNFGNYYRSVFMGGVPVEINSKASPTITAPVSNPRIDILTLSADGTLAWVTGTEASTPSAPWSSVSGEVVPIAEIYMKTTMTKVLEYEDKDTDSNQGYILADVRPFIKIGQARQKGADIASASTISLGSGNYFDITGTTQINTINGNLADGTIIVLHFDSALTLSTSGNINPPGGSNYSVSAGEDIAMVSDGTNWYIFSVGSVTTDFLSLSDTPSSYTSQGLKYMRVKSGETGIEFVDPFNTSSGHDHDGTDSKKVLATNLDLTGLTDGAFIKRSGSSLASGYPEGKSTLIVNWGGLAQTGTYAGIYEGSSLNPFTITPTGNHKYEYGYSQESSYSQIAEGKTPKLAAADTARCYCQMWIQSNPSGDNRAYCKVSIGGQSNEVTTSADGIISPEWRSFTIDISSLSDGSYYDWEISAKTSDPYDSNAYIGAVQCFGE